MYNYWSSSSPGLLVIVLRESCSWSCNIVNRIIDMIIQINSSGNKVKNRCFMSIIGYNHDVKEISSGWLSELAEKPLRYDTVKKQISDGAGGIVEVEEKIPVWVEPIKEDSKCDVDLLAKLIKIIASRWTKTLSHIPIIFDVGASLQDVPLLHEKLQGLLFVISDNTKCTLSNYDCVPQEWEFGAIRKGIKDVKLFDSSNWFNLCQLLFDSLRDYDFCCGKE